MDNSISNSLKDFNKVWKRVQESKKAQGSAAIMPGKQPKKRSRRNLPPK